MYKKLLVSIVGVFLIMLGLFGCQKNESETVSESESVVTVIIAGHHENSQQIECDLKGIIRQCYSTFGNIAVIINDGTPAVLKDAKGDKTGVLEDKVRRESKTYSEKNREKWEISYLNELTDPVFEEIMNACPDSNETDMLYSLQKAVETLCFLEESIDENVKKEIVIYDTGLSTSGKLNFLEGEAYQLLGSDKKISEDDVSQEILSTLMDTLENSAELPDMDGIIVKWYGIGAVCSPQDQLSQLQVNNLKYIWQTLLKRAGADFPENINTDKESSYFKSSITEGEVVYDYYVTPVIFWEKADIEIEHKKLGGFEEDSAELSSRDTALKVMEPYACSLSHYPNVDILIVGTTADDGTYGIYPNLSEDRAIAVKQILVEQGIEPDRIETLGMGPNSPWHQSEWVNGDFIEEIAAENRAVHILSKDSEMAKSILEEYED